METVITTTTLLPPLLLPLFTTRTLSPVKIRFIAPPKGLVFNPATPLDHAKYVLDKIDIILLMSVNPGFGGQSFIPSTLDKLREARKMIDESGYDIRLEVMFYLSVSALPPIRRGDAAPYTPAVNRQYHVHFPRKETVIYRLRLVLAAGGVITYMRVKKFVLRAILGVRVEVVQRSRRWQMYTNCTRSSTCGGRSGCDYLKYLSISLSSYSPCRAVLSCIYLDTYAWQLYNAVSKG